MGSKVHLSLNSTAYNRRDSFGLGWADQWDYKFNDEKLLKSNSHNSPCSKSKPSNFFSSSFTASAAAAATASSSSSSATKTMLMSKLSMGTTGSKPMKFGKENKPSNLSSSSSSSSPSKTTTPPPSMFPHKSPLCSSSSGSSSSRKLSALNKKVSLVANSGAHKVKSTTNMGIRWLKKQCSIKALKPSMD